jgi:hypothetical protein
MDKCNDCEGMFGENTKILLRRKEIECVKRKVSGEKVNFLKI